MSRRTQPSPRPADRSAPGGFLHSHAILLIAFAFAVMADPVSSVAYAIEAALRALHGDLALLMATMALVIAIVALVIVNYHQLVGRFPEGGGAAAAAGKAFGEAWAFVPLGALVVDFVLTIAISAAAGSAAIIAFFPGLDGWRVPLTLVLLLGVAGITWFGHLGRALFALMTLAFVGVGSLVVLRGFGIEPAAGPIPGSAATSFTDLSVVLAFPVAMALATGIEAPSSAIAQLGMLDDPGRRRFGRVTLWLTLAIVSWLTLGLTAMAVRLHIGIPAHDSTLVADIARQTGGSLFAAFQLTSGALLLAAASSSFQAGPGLLKALARGGGGARSTGILPTWMGRTNRHHTPYWGVVAYLVVSASVVVAAGGQEQSLVLFYAVAVFVSFLAGLLAMARFSRREGRMGSLALNAVGSLVVAFTLVVNLGRGYPIVSLAASLLVAGAFHRLWVRAGRPGGVSEAERIGEQVVGEELIET